MNIYEIEQEILSCVDEETGEIIDIEKLESLQLEKENKIESIGLWYKNLVSDAAALKSEIDTLLERKKKAESKAEQLKLLLGNILGGGKFETPKIAMFYRRSKAVECDDDFISWAQENADELLTYKPPVPNKAAIKDALFSGMDVKYAGITERNNLVIK